MIYSVEIKMINLVESVPADFESVHDRHLIHMNIMFIKDIKQKAPAEMLKFIYGKNYCSDGRLFALEIMATRNLSTDEILQ